MKILTGIAASSGIAEAKTYVLNKEEIKILKIENLDPLGEIKKLEEALKIAKTQIQNLRNKTETRLGEEKAQIFDAHLEIVNDPSLIDETINKIKDEKINASYALNQVANNIKEIFLSMDDPYMKERAADVSDVVTRIITIIENKKNQDLSLINEEVIIISSDLTPSETSQLDPKFIKGFVTEIGGTTSHSAIMARSLEIPAVVGIGEEQFGKINSDQKILIDGNTGEVIVEPTKKEIELFNKRAEEYKIVIEEEKQFLNKEARTADGWKTKIAMNIGGPQDLTNYKKLNPDGVGLFRTEFLYMESDNWPTEEEQFEAYKKVLENVNNEVVVIRTLDIGGDKTLKYFEFPKEMNPFLGYRAIRLELDKKEIFVTQLRALLRASYYGNLAINIPMIATVDEFKKAKAIIEEVKTELLKEGKKVGKFQLGIMVEVPSTVVLIDKFVKHVDFFSIGTNDLIQYTFAVDRMSKSVSYLYQPLNPVILRMINKVISVSHQYNKWTAICGELAREPKLAPIFAAMELDEFSMSSSSILKIKRLLAKTDKEDAKKLLEKVLDAETEEEVENLINNYFEKNSLFF